MNRSLQRHLSIMLGSTVLLVGLLAAAASFMLAYSEAKEFQDDLLRQIAAFKSTQPLERLNPGTQSNTAVKPNIRDPESRIIIIHLPGDPRPDWLTDQMSTGLHTLDTASDRLRVFVQDTSARGRVIVAQPTEVRDEIAINSALHTLIPLLLLLPLLLWLIVRIVRSELSPITRLAKGLDEQAVDRPQPIADADLPVEITPFIHAINRLLERVNHLMNQQRRFVADAAHELRSPLTALSLQAQNLRQADSLDAMHERVVPLQEGIERARQLTEQLLNLARTQAGPALTSAVDVSAMAREIIAEYLPFAETKNIDLGLEETAPFSLKADPEILRLIIRNALKNAVKYTPKGGEVTLRLLSGGHKATIEIVDNGPGIPATERERVFDTFYREPGTMEEGSGLGLTIAQEAAARLGGTISLHARQEGSGLVFRYQQMR